MRGIPEPQFGDLVASALEVVDGQVVPEGILAAQEDDEALGQPVVVVPGGKLPHVQDSLVVPEALPEQGLPLRLHLQVVDPLARPALPGVHVHADAVALRGGVEHLLGVQVVDAHGLDAQHGPDDIATYRLVGHDPPEHPAVGEIDPSLALPHDSSSIGLAA